MTCGGYQYRPELPFTPGTEAAGVITLKAEEGDAVAVGDVCCLIDTDAERPAGAASPAPKPEAAPAPKAAPAPAPTPAPAPHIKIADIELRCRP